MNVLEAIRDEKLFRPYFGDDLHSWANWLAFLKFLYGLRTTRADRAVIRECTGRKKVKRQGPGFREALLLTGRRSGKSRIAGAIGAYEALFGGHEGKLSKGEQGIVAVLAPGRRQAQIVRQYLRAVFEAPILAGEVVRETRDGFALRNGVSLEILSGDFRTVRGFTLLAAIVDEACFFGSQGEGKVRSDTELVRALRPGLDTVGGRLIAISSPYARRGWAYKTWKNHWGSDTSKKLVWRAPSTRMNPTLSQDVVNERLAEDLAAGRAEYLAEWRDDVQSFLPRNVIEGLVVPNRTELPQRPRVRYEAFVDMSGGRNDAAALAIAHKQDDTLVLDLARVWPAPHNPQTVAREVARLIDGFGLKRVTGDAYSAEWCASAYRSVGVHYAKASKSKGQLYLELLPLLCAGDVELLDCEQLVSELAALERRTRSGGRDSIDHPRGGHDDLANAVAGALVYASKTRRTAGGMRGFEGGGSEDASVKFSRMALAHLLDKNDRTRIGSWDPWSF